MSKEKLSCICFQNFPVPEDLSAYDGLELCLKGDGRRYKLIVRTSSDWDTIGYTLSFDTIEGQWQSVSCIECVIVESYLIIWLLIIWFVSYRCAYLFLLWNPYLEHELYQMLHPLTQATSYRCRHASTLTNTFLFFSFLSFCLFYSNDGCKKFQLMFSKFEYDGKLNPTFVEGAFQLPVSSIRSYIKDPITPRFDACFQFSWFSSRLVSSLFFFFAM